MKMNTRSKIYISIFIVFIVTMIASASYAYITRGRGVGDILNANVATAGQKPVYSAYSDGELEFNISALQMSQLNVTQDAVAVDNANIYVDLTSSSDNEGTRCTYDIVWVWDSKDKYTTSDVPLPYTDELRRIFPYEFSIKINDGAETDLSKYTWDASGKAKLLEGEFIENSSATQKTQKVYYIEVRMYNINAAQRNLFRKEFKAHIEVQNYNCYTSGITGIAVTSYSGNYDGQDHTISVQLDDANSASEIYYSTTTELNKSNYKTAGTKTKPTRKNPGFTNVYWCAAGGSICGSNEIVINGLNDYITRLIGNSSGSGQIIKENNSYYQANSEGNKLLSSDYNIIENTGFEWDSTEKSYKNTNRSTDNSTDEFKNTEVIMRFKPSFSGTYQFCYRVNSETNYDYSALTKNESVIIERIEGHSEGCYYLGNLSPSDEFLINYRKDGSGIRGYDGIYFNFQFIDKKTLINSETIRYEGQDPNNYVSYNGEIWRIIGLFDQTSHNQTGKKLVKIVRNDTIGTQYFNNTNTNIHLTSTNIYTLLNNDYYNRTGGNSSNGLSASARNMVQNVAWYQGFDPYAEVISTPSKVFEYERSGIGYKENYSLFYTGYVGLLYASDFGYSSLSSNCDRTTNMSTACTSGWLNKGLNYWTYSGSDYRPNELKEYYVNSSGALASSAYNTQYDIYPTVYLKDTVYFSSGTGTQSDPYILAI